jgi:hypothetical protein
LIRQETHQGLGNGETDGAHFNGLLLVVAVKDCRWCARSDLPEIQ